MKILFKGLALAVMVIFPAAAQRSVPTAHPPTGPPGGVTGVQTQTGIGQANLGTTLPTTSAPNLNTSVYNAAGVEVQTDGTTGGVNSEVVDSGPSDEDRAFEYLEYNASRMDPVGSTPIIEKMRRIRQ